MFWSVKTNVEQYLFQMIVMTFIKLTNKFV